MTTKELLALVALLDGRFVSGNSVPVERAHIKADEWKLLRSSLAPIATALCAEVEALRKDAERYRWLITTKQSSSEPILEMWSKVTREGRSYPTHEEWGAAIDAARSRNEHED